MIARFEAQVSRPYGVAVALVRADVKVLRVLPAVSQFALLAHAVETLLSQVGVWVLLRAGGCSCINPAGLRLAQ